MNKLIDDSLGKRDELSGSFEKLCTLTSFKDIRKIVRKCENKLIIKYYKESTLIIDNDEDEKVVLSKFYIYFDPQISIILNILNEDWVNYLINFDHNLWVDSQTSIGSTHSLPEEYTTLVSRTRKSKSIIFEHYEDEIISKVEERAALVAGIDVKYLEKLVMVKYNPGDYFNQHHDGSFRSHTLLLYLNDVEGGETVFPELGIGISPIANSGVLWRNVTDSGEMDERLIHAGTTPTSGTKYVINCFFNKLPIRSY
ncbi:2OG-Fe(II) oxygenase superfamily protein [Theileria parva strain Muguga]|uniref:2OG-Fe(II) oxygenase superfamily protein n=1 Tax=Theileria parva strain Muguga TaxID=333668 RepID=UPI001C62468F|nr:2OG-Fe(II) oxygenase superfamily protein [Theileria parva strain Muguga]EAN31156.2 2OG-Fe(II) oxygenase superfamily protein [Theileria parva strain Muguga]